MQLWALAVLKVPKPIRNLDGNFKWLFGSSLQCSGLTFYTDGSVYEARWRDMQSVGFALVAVGEDGRLAKYGLGIPPAWVDSSAASEGWAVFLARQFSEENENVIVTDCQTICNLTAAGAGKATSAT